MNHLKIFGSVCYAHVPKERRRKLDDRSEKSILIGYHPTGGYKLYNPNSQRVFVSRDVLINESDKWRWSAADNSHKEPNMLELDLRNEDNTTREQGEIENGEGMREEQDATINVTNTRPQRNRQLSTRLRDFELFPDSAVDEEGGLVHLAMFADCEPVRFEDAIKTDIWVNAMKEELNAIERNQTWELVNLPKGKKSIDVKWVYKVKLKPTGEVEKYKARLVAKGFLQKPGLDYQEVFSPVTRLETVRLVVALAAYKSW